MPDLNISAIHALLARNTVISGIRIPIIAIAVPGFLVIWMAMIWLEASAIEAELRRAVNDTLSESGYGRMQADVSGRDVVLTGKVSSADAGARAASLAAAVTGVRVVTSTAEVVPLRLAYIAVQRSRDGELVVSGQMPSPDVAADVLQRISTNIRHSSLVRDLAIDPEVTPPAWTEVVTAVAQEANHLQGLEFEIGAGQVAVGGLLDNRSDYTVITHRLLSLLEPAGTEFVNRIGVTPRNLDMATETLATTQAGDLTPVNPDSPVDNDITDSSEGRGNGEGVGDLPGLSREGSAQPSASEADNTPTLVATAADGTDATDQDAATAESAQDETTVAAIGEEIPGTEDGTNDETESPAGVIEQSLESEPIEEVLTLSQCQSRISDLLMSEPITFASNVVKLSVDNSTIVNKIYDSIKYCPTFSILVAGHTDSRGSEAANLSLSQQRAGSVMEALLVLGVDKNRLDARGFGSTIPVASNETSEGRRLNRRIEIVLSDPEGE